jgi:NAD(P)-dependent dehydrogenase (short-subunit alcohol dehydrogenase family)
MGERRTAVLTGATSGLGEAAALALAARGWRVLVVGRDAARGATVVAQARAAGGKAELITGDLFTVAGARRVADEVRARVTELQLLVNNAGGAFSRTEQTADGIERTVALNVLAPFVLAEALRPVLVAGRGRIVNVVTGVPKSAKTSLDELFAADASAGLGAYIRAKLALVTLTIEQQRRWGGSGITAVSLHPGVIPGTRFGSEMPAFMRKLGPMMARLLRLGSTVDEAAVRYLRVGTEPVEGGGFYYEGQLGPAQRQAQDAAFASALWSQLEALAGRAAAIPPASMSRKGDSHRQTHSGS